MRVGFGYDIHRLVSGRPLVIGGATIPYSRGEDGHSDGDVLIHALIDALLGATSLGDIGTHFPPGDPAYKGISSRILLKKVRDMLESGGWSIGNCDCTVVLEEPKLAPHINQIKTLLSSDLGTPSQDISVKAKTKEKLDSTGKGEAIEAFAVVLVEKR
jgi:2-C-methyl-D-erythritol 2,4-cyclodiphosphate synthase